MGDQLDVEVSSGAGFVTLDSYTTDQGVPNTSGLVKAYSLNAFLGEEEVRVRFRYHDPTPGNDSGSYVQIDDFVIGCSGGADVRSSISTDKDTVTEGEDVTYTFDYTNDGPQAANSIFGFGGLPPGFVPIETQVSGGGDLV